IAVYTPYALVAFNYAYAGDTCYLQLDQPHRLEFRYRDSYRGLDEQPLAPGLLGPDLEARLAGHRVFLILNQEGEEGKLVREWFRQRFGVVRALDLTTLYSWGEIHAYLLEAGSAP